MRTDSAGDAVVRRLLEQCVNKRDDTSALGHHSQPCKYDERAEHRSQPPPSIFPGKLKYLAHNAWVFTATGQEFVPISTEHVAIRNTTVCKVPADQPQYNAIVIVRKSKAQITPRRHYPIKHAQRLMEVAGTE